MVDMSYRDSEVQIKPLSRVNQHPLLYPWFKGLEPTMAEFWRESASANEISITHKLNILRFIFSDLSELDSSLT